MDPLVLDIVVANLTEGSREGLSCLCRHVWRCPHPWHHEMTGDCADCENLPDIRDEHAADCVLRRLAFLKMATKGEPAQMVNTNVKRCRG